MPAGMLCRAVDRRASAHHWTETRDADIVTRPEVFVEACRRLCFHDD